jgi:hypothetical protein
MAATPEFLIEQHRQPFENSRISTDAWLGGSSPVEMLIAFAGTISVRHVALHRPDRQTFDVLCWIVPTDLVRHGSETHGSVPKLIHDHGDPVSMLGCQNVSAGLLWPSGTVDVAIVSPEQRRLARTQETGDDRQCHGTLPLVCVRVLYKRAVYRSVSAIHHE